ncbi:MAG: hypothetical protein CK425_02170 [Parachlamydia sp.]|nr:MAG: hypothetical protein CK425_02170 [Parachlamydia sp.]
MNSYAYYVGRYSAELQLAIDKGWQFDQEGKISPVCQGKVLSRDAVLTKIYKTLQSAPVYSMDKGKCRKFEESVRKYAASGSGDEGKKAKRISNQIQKLVKEKANHIFSCFFGSNANKVNSILDKDSTKITPKEYLLLYDLANLFAFERFTTHTFYHKASILQKMEELREKCPNINIKKESDATTNPFIVYEYPTSAIDCQLALWIEWHQMKEPDLTKVNPEVIKKIIQGKLESSDPKFQRYLEDRLMLYILYALASRWKEVGEEEMSYKELETLVCEYKTDKETFDACSCEFIHHPASYTELGRREPTFATPFDDPSEVAPIAKELRLYASDTNNDFDKWYQAIYKKIQSYQQSNHPEAALPFFNPDKFSAYNNFIDKNDIAIPLMTQFREWEKTASLDFAKSKQQTEEASTKPKTASAKPKKNSSRRKFLKPVYEDREKEPSGEKEPTEPVAQIGESLINTEPYQTAKNAQPKKKIKKSSSSAASKRIATPPAIIKSIHEALAESSPFAVKKRVTDWFDPSVEVEILNKESKLIHNIGWAANLIAWELGTRYLHSNQFKGEFQPAIALLCDVQHAFFPKPELFLMTFTFDHIVDRESFNPEFKYDPTWPCFHRALTRRDQYNQVVDEYMEIAKNQLIDFPALPSQAQQLQLSKEFDRRPFPDGSYIESIEGGVVTIRDPKHDTKLQQCRLRLFIIQ